MSHVGGRQGQLGREILQGRGQVRQGSGQGGQVQRDPELLHVQGADQGRRRWLGSAGERNAGGGKSILEVGSLYFEDIKITVRFEIRAPPTLLSFVHENIYICSILYNTQIVKDSKELREKCKSIPGTQLLPFNVPPGFFISRAQEPSRTADATETRAGAG